MASPIDLATGDLAAATIARLSRRLLPLLFALYIVAYLDRVNVGFAALAMNRQLGLGPEEFGLGAGLFFIGYFILEIPSNLILARIGARRWIARILVSWGVAAIAMAAVRGPRSFYLLRATLGMAEAGFFPGVIFYLTSWFPSREQARAIAIFMTATALAGVIGGPLSGAILTIDGFLGLAGWQWLFVIEGLPAVVLGAVVLRYLPDRPEQAGWLSVEQRQWLIARLRHENRPTPPGGLCLGNIFDLQVGLLSAIYFLLVSSLYGIAMWLPQIIRNFGARSDFTIGLLAAIPYLIAAIAMVAVGRSSDRRGERRWHVALSLFAAAGGFVLAADAHGALALAALSLAALGTCAALGPFWSLARSSLNAEAAAAGIALINSVGNLGGFVGPFAIGLLRQRSQAFAGALMGLGIAVTTAGILGLLARPTVRASEG
ncbi:MAG TPA: MFS transporter [Candidatus Binataceae bacterium]|nr:MFS transporter [Candidatus Binataceae bacterium]